MKPLGILAAALSLTGCGQPVEDAVPVDSIIELVEARLATHPCIGDLNAWERNYRFAKSTGYSAYTSHADLDVVEFHLRRAGSTTIAPGRNILRRDDVDDWPDGKGITSIDGRFRMSDKRLTMPPCPPNRR